jgi:hypothetical protein
MMVDGLVSGIIYGDIGVPVIARTLAKRNKVLAISRYIARADPETQERGQHLA